MSVYYKYVAAREPNYLKQVKRVQMLIDARMKRLAEKHNLPIANHGNSKPTAYDFYIEQTKGMEQVDKMIWLSREVDMDPVMFMEEWNAMNDLSRYHHHRDIEGHLINLKHAA